MAPVDYRFIFIAFAFVLHADYTLPSVMTLY